MSTRRSLGKLPNLFRMLGPGLAMMLVALASGARAEPLKAGETFPDLKSFNLEGSLPSVEKARVVIVDFWASWCAPCKASFPVYDALQREYGPKGLQVVAVNVDVAPRAMETFLKRNPVSFSVVRDAAQKLVEKVAVPTMPTAFVLDARGTVRFVHVGFFGEESRRKYVEQIQTLLEESP